jgi:hypothetical protein
MVSNNKIAFTEALRTATLEYMKGKYYFGSMLMAAIIHAGGSEKLEFVTQKILADWFRGSIIEPHTPFIKEVGIQCGGLVFNMLMDMYK